MIVIDNILHYIRGFISAIGVMVICAGAIRGIYHLYMMVIYKKYGANYVRLQFGDSVMLGLEFMVGGDIVGSLAAPDYYNLGLLAIIVLIRTILSYFLTQELRELKPSLRQKIK